ncbi:MAG: anthranilate synthase component II, partial [Candidatus Gastranaerophilaceae bacterium]
ICEVFGAKITYAPKIMHGKVSEIEIDNSCQIFKNLPSKIKVARYHSLIADEKSLPEELIVTAKTEDGIIMAVKHRVYEIYGLQFHPESVLTPEGKVLARNFMEKACK